MVGPWAFRGVSVMHALGLKAPESALVCVYPYVCTHVHVHKAPAMPRRFFMAFARELLVMAGALCTCTRMHEPLYCNQCFAKE
jgi:hypothetical protein